MATIRAIAVANTVAGTPRQSAAIDYDGTSNKTIIVTLVCPTWASADPAQTTTVKVQQSFDNGTTWETFASMSALGGRVGMHGGNMPQMTCQDVDDRGLRKARIELSVDIGSLTAGVDLTN